VCLFFVTSCSDDTTTPTTAVNYLPTTVGSNWIFENYILDSTNSRVNASSPVIDSMVVAGTEVKLAQTATVFQHYTNTNKAGYVVGNKWYFYSANENVYVYSGLFNELLGLDKFPVKLPFTIDEKWMTLIDANNTTWNLHTKDIANDTIDYGGTKYPFSGSFKIDATKQAKEDLTIGSTKLNCQKINYLFSISGKVKYGFFEIPITLSGNCSMWYADKVGLVKIYFQSQKLSVQGLMEQSMNGTEQNLIRYNIK
jgi:hypothetical protein